MFDTQWRNRWGAECPPKTSDREIFADVLGKKRQGKKEKGVKIEKKRRKIVKGKVENWKLDMEVGKVIKRGEDPFFFFFFFFAFHFWKRRNFVLGPPKWEFSTRKKHFMPGKKSGKITLPPQKNMPVTPCWHTGYNSSVQKFNINSPFPYMSFGKLKRCWKYVMQSGKTHHMLHMATLQKSKELVVKLFWFTLYFIGCNNRGLRSFGCTL